MATKFRINPHNFSLQCAVPIGSYNGMVTVWEDATDEEIEKAIHEDC